MGKILGLIVKIILIICGLFLVYCATIGHEYGMKQLNKVKGMYYVNEGDKAFRENNMQEAINNYRTGLELFPEHYEAWFNLGNIYVAYEDYFSATEAYQNAILANDKYSLARMNLGIITAEKLGDFDSAISQYRSIISSKPLLITIPFVYDNKKSETANKAIAYYNMGRAYAQKALYLPQDKFTEKREYLRDAVNAYESAINIIDNNYEMFYNLGLTYHLLGDYQKAGQNYCNAIQVEPMHYEAHYNLGLLLRHLQQETYAIDELEKAAVLSSGDISNHSKYIFDVLSAVSTNALNKGVPSTVYDLKKKEFMEKAEAEAKAEALKEKNNKKKHKKFKKKDTEKDINSELLEFQEQLILVNGKVTPTEENDQKIIENFRKCNSKFMFDVR